MTSPASYCAGLTRLRMRPARRLARTTSGGAPRTIDEPAPVTSTWGAGQVRVVPQRIPLRRIRCLFELGCRTGPRGASSRSATVRVNLPPTRAADPSHLRGNSSATARRRARPPGEPGTPRAGTMLSSQRTGHPSTGRRVAVANASRRTGMSGANKGCGRSPGLTQRSSVASSSGTPTRSIAVAKKTTPAKCRSAPLGYRCS